MARNILITGGTGFIGHHLCRQFLDQGDCVTVLSRQSLPEVQKRCGAVTRIDSLQKLSASDTFDVIINLAGEPIADKRWSAKQIEKIKRSRFDITRALVELIEAMDQKPAVFLSGSAVGYYGRQMHDQPVGEDHLPTQEFTHELCMEWEAIASRVAPLTRVCLLRTGLVLDRDEGFMKRLWLPFKMGLGGRLGDGAQWMPWIHLDDMLAAIHYTVSAPDLNGPINFTAPNPVTNREFTQSLATSLSRPAFFPVPACMLKLMLGELSDLLLTGQRATPDRLTEHGFHFRYHRIEDAFESLT